MLSFWVTFRYVFVALFAVVCCVSRFVGICHLFFLLVLRMEGGNDPKKNHPRTVSFEVIPKTGSFPPPGLGHSLPIAPASLVVPLFWLAFTTVDGQTPAH